MTLSTAALIYYSIATPVLLLMCKMMYVGGKDKTRGLDRPSYQEALNDAHSNITKSEQTIKVGRFLRVDFSNGTRFVQVYKDDGQRFSGKCLGRHARALKDGWSFNRRNATDMNMITVLDGRPSKEDVCEGLDGVVFSM